MKRIKKNLVIIMLMTVGAFVIGCSPEDPDNGGSNNGGGDNDDGNGGTVVVTTNAPKDITTNTAVCGGFMTVSEGMMLNELGVCWSTKETPTIEDAHLYTENWNELFFICTIEGLEPETKYYVCAYAKRDQELYYGDVLDFTTLSDGGLNDHDYVDLGLPSGILWATCNVGAEKPEDYGDYYAWGETSTKNNYQWTTYKYCDGESKLLTKYCNYSEVGYNGFTDDLAVLQSDDDAAAINWGSNWRMPTGEEFEELFQNTTNTWLTLNGVNGRLFSAMNGNSLFLPASGGYIGESIQAIGEVGLYWSSSLDDWPRVARALYINSDYCEMEEGDASRCYGLPVRPVQSSK